MLIRYVGITCLMAFLTACSNTETTPIKIGINPWPGYEFLYLAQEKGFFKEQGVDVKIIEYASLSDVRRGYERGNLDAMASTLIEVLQVKNNSTRDPNVFLIADYSNGGDVILARDINSLKELKGKRIAADTTSLPIFILTRALEQAGLNLTDVEIIPMEQSDIPLAYKEMSIDAAVTYPPISLQLSKRQDTKTIFSSADIPGEVVDVVSAESSILKERKNDFKKILRAWDRALEFTKKHPDEAYEIMGNRESITAAEFKAAVNDMEILSVTEQKKYFPSLPSTLNRVRDVLVDSGVLPNEISADCCINQIN